jgi:predicted Zn-dependent protease
MLVSESQEIAMGQEADPSIVAQMGVYADTAMQAYVTRLGTDLAARTERPQLPWTFRVIDDPVVNAFALPGGFVYMTRGILAHFSSEAELVSVLGHEIGHVTARHSAAQMSQQQLAGLGVGVGSILAPELAPLLGAAQAGLGLLFLKFGRDDESEADRLGLRYMVRAQYDPNEMPNVFRMLGRVSSLSGGGRIPEWQSTHPNPENREEEIEQAIAQLEAQGQQFEGFTVERASYLRRIDGMVFGANPREGYFAEDVFYHPDLAFEFTFPTGWQHVNLRQAVVAQSPEKDGIMQLSLAEEATPSEAAQVFLGQQGVQREAGWRDAINGLAVSSAVFRASTEQGTLAGLVAFVAHGGRVYRLLGYTPVERWSTYSTPFGRAFESFARVTDRSVLEVQPARIQIVTLDREMTFAEFERRYPSSVASELVAAINGIDTGATIPAGTEIKRVVGGASP